ncbi:MAG: aminoacetone oxidase family FAD-binding enzyme [Pseudorhodoferax sp.]
MNSFDVVIIGAGAAGLFCAGIAGQRGLRVLLLDHSAKVAEKIRISGGGRANFTNLDVGPRNFLSDNPHFCRGALARFTPRQFIALLQRDGIGFHEKHRGQLFCDRSAEDLIDLLLRECAAGHVTRWQPCAVHELRTAGDATARYLLATDRGEVQAHSVVVATGGLSIPKIGASDYGYRIARQFGLRLVEQRPALVPLTFDERAWQPFAQLAGLSLPVDITTGEKKARTGFSEDLLFTHRGLSGPAVLQISSYWKPGTPIGIDLSPQTALQPTLQEAKLGTRRLLANVLGEHLPARLAAAWTGADASLAAAGRNETLRQGAQRPGRQPARLATDTHRHRGLSQGRGHCRRRGDTRDLSSQTMESRQSGLYFIGEVVDVTGWLGGYNFQWAWSSAYSCAQALSAS